MRDYLVPLCAVSIVCLPLDSGACGDSLYRVGKGVSYRIYSAPLPGNLLVYAQAAGAEQLAAGLTESGHTVRVAGNAADFESELRGGHYDVVIAPYSERVSVELAVMAQQSTVSILPVAMNRTEEREALQTFEIVLVADRHEIKHYLKAIHKLLVKDA